MNLPKQVSTNYCINGVMEQESLLLDIKPDELESDWHLFEQTISALEPLDQNCPSKFNQQSTKFTQSYSTMAPKMRGSLTDAAKSKAQAVVEAKKKAIEDEKKM